MMRRARWFLPALAYYGLIFYLSSRTSFPVEEPFAGFDKVAHLAEFGGLGFLLALGFAPRFAPLIGGTRILAFLTGLVLGLLDEFHQVFVPLRTADVWDAAADALGIALGLGAYALLRAYIRRKRKRDEA